MRAEFLKIVGLIIIGLVVIIGTLAAVQMLSVSPLWTEEGAAWVGAIGTVGTLIGTVWLATTETRRRHTEELARANIVVSALTPRISLLRSELFNMAEGLAFLNEETGRRDTPRAEAALVLETNYRPATSEELLSLTPLGNNYASQLAYAQSQLSVFRDFIEAHVVLFEQEDPNAPLDDATADEWRNWIGGVHDRFWLVEMQFVEIARKYARLPDGEELHG